MRFNYKVIDETGKPRTGEIEAGSENLAINALQEKKYVVILIEKTNKKRSIFKSINIFDKIPMKDIVMMSRQFASLFDAQVPAIRAFQMMSGNVDNQFLQRILESITEDIKGGVSISDALAKHPDAFSDFYVNMVAAGEESGKLTDTFSFLADYLERNYELIQKTKNALVYPAFVIVTFFVVMILMLTMVIPRLSVILLESGQEIPSYTKFVIWLSDFFVSYGWFILAAVVIGAIFLAKSTKTEKGKLRWAQLKLELPYFKKLFQKLYLSRIADNMSTMLAAGIPVVRSLEITSTVIDNDIYSNIILNSAIAVKSGRMISDTFAQHSEIPSMLVQMIRIGEETGTLSDILQKLSKFYVREVNNAVDTLIGLIEPAMIVSLGVGVGFLLTAIMVPILNITSGI